MIKGFGRLAAIVALLVAALLAPATAARAGQWIQVSCANPNGSAASSDGWAGSTAGNPGAGSDTSVVCPGMSAFLGGPATAGDSELLTYTPPSGSKLVGGSLMINAHAEGLNTASGLVAAMEPAPDYTHDTVFQCSQALGCGGTNPATYSGLITLPANLGGTLTLEASCGGSAGTQCSSGANGDVSDVTIQSAQLELSNGAVPTGTGFTGTLLQPNASGQAQLVFTAGDSGGPGVNTTTVQIDGSTVYSGNPVAGVCSSVGKASDGTLMFDGQQPCPVSESETIPIDTTQLSNGQHQLSVSVTDAAGNSATVESTSFTVQNAAAPTPTPTPIPTPTPKPKKKHKAASKTVTVTASAPSRPSLAIHWSHFRISHVTARSFRTTDRLAVRCSGPHCPKLPAPITTTRPALSRVVHALAGLLFHPGDNLSVTVSGPKLRTAHATIELRAGHKPQAVAPKRRKRRKATRQL